MAYSDVSLVKSPGSDSGDRPRRYTLCTTFRCNLSCSYCYVSKNPSTMSLETAGKSLDFIFHHAPPESRIEIGFFGGEPLLEFSLLQRICRLLADHPRYDPRRVSLTLTTNGTIFSPEIADFLKSHRFKVCVSCDGLPQVQNLMRRTADGKDTAEAVEETLVAAQQALSPVLVNAVFHPQTFRFLPETLDYLAGLGLRYLYFNPDYSAAWTPQEAAELPAVYEALAERYVAWYLSGEPRFLNLLDTKIAVLMRGGYHPSERCQLGAGEMAITPDGGLYPCERLIGSGQGEAYRIGSVDQGVDLSRLVCHCVPEGSINAECRECGIRDFCMNWCGCSNVFMTGYYNRVGPFLCASERALMAVALEVFTTLERRLGPVFLHHFSGMTQLNSRLEMKESSHIVDSRVKR